MVWLKMGSRPRGLVLSHATRSPFTPGGHHRDGLGRDRERQPPTAGELGQVAHREPHLEGDDEDDVGHDLPPLHPPDLVWTSIGYGAVVSAVVAGILVAVAGRDRRPAVLVLAPRLRRRGVLTGHAGHGAWRSRGYAVARR